jgi:hypothetical protein
MLVRFLHGFVVTVGAVVCLPVQATELMAVRGVVHDPGHRHIAGAAVTLHAADSDLVENEKTNANGEFSFSGSSCRGLHHYRGPVWFRSTADLWGGSLPFSLLEWTVIIKKGRCR